MHTARDCEVSKGVVWVQLLLVSETSWPESLDAEIAQSPHAGVQASSPWYTILGVRVGNVLCMHIFCLGHQQEIVDACPLVCNDLKSS